MRPSYRRLLDWSDRTDAGTNTIQTSGTLPLSGQVILTQPYSLHSYQLVPMAGTPGYDAALKIEVSNDNLNWTRIAEYPFSTSTGAQLAYSDTWAFSYARATVTGTEGTYLLNEVHLA
tara:strand:- start:851 stop:1204 length:354 start_codon:yes stop_codon:yes gene_type:complete